MTTVQHFRPAPRSLADVADPDGDVTYPVNVLEAARTALVLFSAGFHGRQDAYWFAAAGVRGTCVDIDARRLGEMEAVYPDGWEFVEADVFKFGERNKGRLWDVVSLDPFTDLFQRCADLLPLWCSLAMSAVVLGTGHDTRVVSPDGWRCVNRMYRSPFSGGVYWTVLKPC